MLRMAGDKEPTEKTLMASSSAPITSQHSVNGARTFGRIKDSRNVNAAAWERKVWDYIKEKLHLLPPPSHLSPLQDLVPSLWNLDDETLDNDYILYDDSMRDVRDYTGGLDFTANIPAKRENASGVSVDSTVKESVDQIRTLTRKNLLTPAAPSLGTASPAEPLPGGEGVPSLGGALSPSGGEASTETGGHSPPPVPSTAKRGIPKRSNRIPRHNVVTWRAAAEQTGVAARYKGVGPTTTMIATATLLWRMFSSRVCCTSCDN